MERGVVRREGIDFIGLMGPIGPIGHIGIIGPRGNISLIGPMELKATPIKV